MVYWYNTLSLRLLSWANWSATQKYSVAFPLWRNDYIHFYIRGLNVSNVLFVSSIDQFDYKHSGIIFESATSLQIREHIYLLNGVLPGKRVGFSQKGFAYRILLVIQFPNSTDILVFHILLLGTNFRFVFITNAFSNLFSVCCILFSDESRYIPSETD